MKAIKGVSEGTEVTMHWFTKAWYNMPDSLPQINIGVYHEDGSVDGEFNVTWFQLGSGRKPAARVQIFEDAWAVFPILAPVFAELAKLHGTNPTEQEVFDVLLAAGVVDKTEYEHPKGEITQKERTVNVTIPVSLAKRMDLID